MLIFENFRAMLIFKQALIIARVRYVCIYSCGINCTYIAAYTVFLAKCFSWDFNVRTRTLSFSIIKITNCNGTFLELFCQCWWPQYFPYSFPIFLLFKNHLSKQPFQKLFQNDEYSKLFIIIFFHFSPSFHRSRPSSILAKISVGKR